MLSKDGLVEGEIDERVVKGRNVKGELARVMNVRIMPLEVKREFRNTGDNLFGR